MPREQSGQKFLVGTVNKHFTVGIALEGDPFVFHDLPALDGRRGFVVHGSKIHVDPQSSIAARDCDSENVPLGALILHEQSVAILAKSRKSFREFVVIKGDHISTDADAVAFTRWAIVAEDEKGLWEPLFSNNGVESIIA